MVVKTFFSLIAFIELQEFGDSARARKLYEQDSDDDDDEELEINPKLEAGESDKKVRVLENILSVFFDFEHLTQTDFLV